MSDWVIVDVCKDHLSECLDCSYVGTDWAENDNFINLERRQYDH